jgi:hypothetical protein
MRHGIDLPCCLWVRELPVTKLWGPASRAGTSHVKPPIIIGFRPPPALLPLQVSSRAESELRLKLNRNAAFKTA